MANEEKHKSEAEILSEVKLMSSMIPGVRLFRNNTGKLRDSNGRLVEFGLCPGSSDLIGFQSFVVKPEHVGMRVARFLAVECKSAKGKESPQQKNFGKIVADFGGKYLVCSDASLLKPSLAITDRSIV